MLTKCGFRWGLEIPGLKGILRNSFTVGLSLAPANTSTLSYQDDEGNYYTAIIKRGKLCLNKYLISYISNTNFTSYFKSLFST